MVEDVRVFIFHGNKVILINRRPPSDSSGDNISEVAPCCPHQAVSKLLKQDPILSDLQ